MKVIIQNEAGARFPGTCVFSKGRGKNTVMVCFDDDPLGIPHHPWTIQSAEFRLSTGQRIIWGQGIDQDANDWWLNDQDCATIIREGGG